MGSDLNDVAQLVRKNCGIALLARQHRTKIMVRSGELVCVLPDWKAPHGIFHAVYPSRRGLFHPLYAHLIDYLIKRLSFN